MSQQYEQLGAFYLGKKFEQQSGQLTDELLLYDAKDLTTHAVCVGMTGSGKTGLCLSLLEEAAIDGVPAIAVDPKGDLGNLMLTFPELAAADFRPWIDESEAVRRGLTPDQYARKTADLWRKGLADWGQDGSRIERMRNAVDMALYTPGSSAGRPLTVLKSFDPPSADLIADEELFRERIAAATSGLLTLLGIDADPLSSREYILLANIFDTLWRAGKSIGLADLIGTIQQPPLKRIGVLDLETFFPVQDRRELAMRINNLLASPSFAGWLSGEPLDIQRLLYTADGRPRLSILSIAHLSDSERMFFVTILLNELTTWMRTQAGTSSLRALFYMDEVFGYFPPVSNPPSKTPMLTLLKQARAYGLGLVLATQNPGDLDYKGLSNAGTWFLGRLQTERDKQRVLEGLQGASTASGKSFDRQQMAATLAGLGNRVFLMNNVHEDQPVVFQVRWAMSYLRGPLTRGQVQKLTAGRSTASTDSSTLPEAIKPEPAPQFSGTSPADGITSQQALAGVVEQRYLAPRRRLSEDAKLIYRPALFGVGRLHFVRSSYGVDHWQESGTLQILRGEIGTDTWTNAATFSMNGFKLLSQPAVDGEFADVPAELQSRKHYSSWAKRLKTHLYRTQVLRLWKCAALKEFSKPGEAEGEFRIRLRQAAREHRDLELERLRSKFAARASTLEERCRAAQRRIEEERSQYRKASFDTMISFGSTLLGAFLGRKVASKSNVSKAATSMRSVGRAADQRNDIGQAEEKLESLEGELATLEQQFKEDVDELETQFSVNNLELEPLELRPRKSDIELSELIVLWTPWDIAEDGLAEPLFELPASAVDQEGCL